MITKECSNAVLKLQSDVILLNWYANVMLLTELMLDAITVFSNGMRGYI